MLESPYQPPPPQTVLPKSPAVAVLLSFLVPGLGSMTSGASGVGVIILITYILGWILTLVFVGFLIVPAAWIWGMVHAHGAAVAWNRQHGIAS